MQDLKHLINKKRFDLSATLGISGSNRRIKPQGESLARRLASMFSRYRRNLKYALIFFVIVAALTPLFVILLKNGPAFAKAASLWFQSLQAPSLQISETPKTPPRNSFEAAYSLLETASMSSNPVVAKSPTTGTYHYSIRGDLQQRVHDFMAAKQVPYGVLVAMEPSTGRILAMTAYSAVDPQWPRSAFFDIYPMASLFKIITASAALEAGKITPDTVMEFRGGAYSENPGNWNTSRTGKNNQMDVSDAMGKSINPLYGQMACNIAGKDAIMERIRLFGFNQTLLPGMPAKISRANEPGSDRGLMLMGAGLDREVKISPIHGALIMSAIANGGRMMAPTITDRILDTNGSELEVQTPREIRQTVSSDTAVSLTRMLSSTVTSGTSRRAFHDSKGRPILGSMEIAAKTGSINGTSPKGHYSWFAGYAPARDPRIVVVALVINHDKWKIKSSQLGELAFEVFFGK